MLERSAPFPSRKRNGAKSEQALVSVPFFAVSFQRDLLPRMVDPRVSFKKKLGNGDDGITFPLERLDDARQRLRRMFCRVVEQHDTPRLYPLEDPIADLFRADAFPIQTVDRPLHGCHPETSDRLDYMVVVLSVWASEQCRLCSGAGGNLPIGFAQICGDLLRAHHGKMLVV